MKIYNNGFKTICLDCGCDECTMVAEYEESITIDYDGECNESYEFDHYTIICPNCGQYQEL